MGRNSLQSKRHNRGLVIGQLLTGVCGSRIELARRTGLSKMTVTNIVADFIAQGMVEECEEQLTETCGRNPIRLRIGSGAPRVAGLLVQREGIVAALCTLELKVLKTEEVSFLSVSKDQLPVYACEVLDRLLAGESNLLAIGVARAVSVDLRSFLEERYRLPVIVDEDGASAAQAEKLLGAGQGADDFVYVGLGDHISSGIISGGKVLRSARGGRLPAGTCKHRPEWPALLLRRQGLSGDVRRHQGGIGEAVALRRTEAALCPVLPPVRGGRN